jgi:hypothetical protein
MLHTIEGKFSVYREVAEWCLSAGIEGYFVVRKLNRTLQGSEMVSSPVYIEDISFEDAAEGSIKHAVWDDNTQTRIIGPTLLEITTDIELFYLRFKGLHGINVYREF